MRPYTLCYYSATAMELPSLSEGGRQYLDAGGEISHMMDVLLGWDATAELIDDWMYEKVANAYALDPEMQAWMKAGQSLCLAEYSRQAARGHWPRYVERR